MINKEKIRENLKIFLAGAVFSLMLLMSIGNVDAKLAFDNDCPVSATNNVNFSNGTSVFLPFSYNNLPRPIRT